jgi:hypothetical protein
LCEFGHLLHEIHGYNSKTQERNLDEEKGASQGQWTEKWRFVENKGSIICAIGKQSVSVPTDALHDGTG